MLDRYFNVLIVDDEPDVRAVSRLTLKRVSVYGLPLRIHEAGSKVEAVDFLTRHPEGNSVSLAIVDVVMETDHAGLELCAFIRGTLDNHVMPLIVRTGQAGKAPEQTVIDEYEITGYINKVEATERRLYSLIKAGVRQYCMAAYDHYASQLLYYVITNLRSAARFRKAVETGLAALVHSPRGPKESLHDSHCMISTTFFAGTGDLADSVRARALRDHLRQADGTQLSPSGDSLVVTGTHMLIHIEPTRDYPLPLQSLWSVGAAPPPFVVKTLYMATRQIQVLMGMVGR